MLSVEDVKNYCRATDEDDEMILTLMDASESYLAGAIDNYASLYESKGRSWRAKADLAKKLLVADWYENRLATERPVSPAIRLILTQLQLEGGV